MKNEIIKIMREFNFEESNLMIPYKEEFMIQIEATEGSEEFNYLTIIMKHKGEDLKHYEDVIDNNKHITHAYSVSEEDVADFIYNYILRYKEKGVRREKANIEDISTILTTTDFCEETLLVKLDMFDVYVFRNFGKFGEMFTYTVNLSTETDPSINYNYCKTKTEIATWVSEEYAQMRGDK